MRLLQVLARAIYDRWWLAYIYFLLTVITCVQVTFKSSLVSGASALVACVLSFVGPAGFIGSLRARNENNYSARDLVGIAAIAAILTTAGVSLMIWSGFGLTIYDVDIEGLYWALTGLFIALIVTKKEHVQ